ncbi:MAG: hypothetical protein GTO18_09755 [Anaerolineales bacterium]|nr:hypothetical protein [Anaerolineales bacterium]
MTEQPESNGDLADQFRKMGENLKQNIEAIWNHPQSQEFREEIQSGLDQLGKSLSDLSTEIAESPTSQQIQKDVKDFGERLQTGEVETKVRSDLASLLKKLNEELEKTHQQLTKDMAEDSDVSEQEDI